eukprot:7050687-Karenia_brevis.AAC.1
MMTMMMMIIIIITLGTTMMRMLLVDANSGNVQRVENSAETDAQTYTRSWETQECGSSGNR